MALDAGDARAGTGLAGLMAEKMKEIEPAYDVRRGYQMFDSIAQAVVEHIQSNAEVSTSGDATAVEPGVGTAPVSTTGTIT